jgi:hypothetical protein
LAVSFGRSLRLSFFVYSAAHIFTCVLNCEPFSDGTHTISFVQPGSPAHLAGLQKNEKLLKINGKLTNQLACYQLAKVSFKIQ